MKTISLLATIALALWLPAGTAVADPVIQTAMAENEDGFKAGQTAAQQLKTKLGGVAPKVVIVTECFEDQAQKAAVLKGVASVFPKDLIYGGAVYGMYTQDGVLDIDAVSCAAIGGDIKVTTATVTKMGAAGLSLETQKDELASALHKGGVKLAKQLSGLRDATMMILIGDAHSPKNQFLLDGVQEVAGKRLPVTGGSICKNAGQTFVFSKGEMHADSAIAILLKADLKISQAGRQAKSNEEVVSTAKEGAASALKSLGGKPAAVFAFDCGGRMGKLDRLEDELEAIQSSVGKDVPIYGAYCAGEFGPADTRDAADKDDRTSIGRGWHIMLSILGK